MCEIEKSLPLHHTKELAIDLLFGENAPQAANSKRKEPLIKFLIGKKFLGIPLASLGSGFTLLSFCPTHISTRCKKDIRFNP
jgi:hypothetical protein